MISKPKTKQEEGLLNKAIKNTAESYGFEIPKVDGLICRLTYEADKLVKVQFLTYVDLYLDSLEFQYNKILKNHNKE